MIHIGEYMAPITFYKGDKFWRIRHEKLDHRHCHVHCSKGYRAIRAIIKAANKGEIDFDMPEWMIHDVNRLWFGEDYLENDLIRKDIMHVADPEIRIIGYKRRPKKRLKYDKHQFIKR